MINKLAFKKQSNGPLVAIFFLALSGCGGGGDAPNSGGAANSVAGSTTGSAVAPLPAPVAAAAVATPPASSPASSPASPPASPTAVAPASVTSAAGDASCGLNGTAGIEAEVIQRINALRAAGAVCGTNTFAPAGALTWNTTLLAAARGHSADMAQKNYFSHTSQDGRTAGQRITAAGYNWSTFGENIAAGQTSVQQVMTGWINSPGHCQNLMNANVRDVALACVRNDAADYRLYWTMNLGRSR